MAVLTVEPNSPGLQPKIVEIESYSGHEGERNTLSHQRLGAEDSFRASTWTITLSNSATSPLAAYDLG